MINLVSFEMQDGVLRIDDKSSDNGNASSVVDVFLWSCLSKTRGARFFFDTCQVTWGERKQGGL